MGWPQVRDARPQAVVTVRQFGSQGDLRYRGVDAETACRHPPAFNQVQTVPHTPGALGAGPVADGDGCRGDQREAVPGVGGVGEGGVD